jgi:hypothetical protein
MSDQSGASNLRPGDEVEVRSKEEILRTLAADGSLDALPFMPEMLAYCGRRFRVAKRAHKVCDTITYQGVRHLKDAVHLAELRCDGSAHGGCQAACLLIWKEAWLRRVGDSRDASAPAREPAIDEAGLAGRTRVAEEIFRCQATELNRASTPVSFHAPTTYLRDLRSGNVRLREVVRWIAFDVVTALMKLRGYRLWMGIYNRVASWFGGIPYPAFEGTQSPTPTERLGLAPGDRIRVKDREAIVASLDAKNQNRGLSFDVEMVGFCGKTARVLARVDQIIDEKTGRMLRMKTPAIILEGVTCQAHFKNKGCTRAIYPYWREIWLERTQR